MVFYYIKFRTTKAQRMTARYGKKVLRKGKTYTVRRKLTPTSKRHLKKGEKIFGYKVLSVKKV